MSPVVTPIVSEADLQFELDGGPVDVAVPVEEDVGVERGGEIVQQADTQVVVVLYGHRLASSGAPEHTGLRRQRVALKQCRPVLGRHLDAHDVRRGDPVSFHGQADTNVRPGTQFRPETSLEPKHDGVLLSFVTRPHRVDVEPDELGQ